MDRASSSAATPGRYLASAIPSAYSNAGLQDDLKRAFRDAGKRLDMGKSCVRFRSLDDLPLEEIGRLIAATPVKKFIETHAAARTR